MKPIRVLVVDDSAFMRKVISDIINNDPNMTVIGTARDGRDALKKIQELNPDVVTMDVEMPGLDGLAALEELMKISPLPVLMISSLTKRGTEQTGKTTNINIFSNLGNHFQNHFLYRLIRIFNIRLF
jgi:two-component system chemotaxis response regulator CheB